MPWQNVKETVEVKLFREGTELYVVAKSGGRQDKENAMRRKKLARLLWTLRGLRREKSRDRLLLRLGAAKAKSRPRGGAGGDPLARPASAPKKGKQQIQKLDPGQFQFAFHRRQN